MSATHSRLIREEMLGGERAAASSSIGRSRHEGMPRQCVCLCIPLATFNWNTLARLKIKGKVKLRHCTKLERGEREDDVFLITSSATRSLSLGDAHLSEFYVMFVPLSLSLFFEVFTFYLSRAYPNPFWKAFKATTLDSTRTYCVYVISLLCTYWRFGWVPLIFSLFLWLQSMAKGNKFLGSFEVALALYVCMCVEERRREDEAGKIFK